MDTRNILLTFIIFLGLGTVECGNCFTSASSTNTGGKYGECPTNKPKCCGTRRNGRQNRCATSCVHFKCETNFDCDGLTCCSGNCSEKKNCLPVSTWGVVGIAVVCLFFLITLFRACQWCHKRAKVCTRQEEQPPHNQPPFVVSDFDNHGFMTPMAPPAYDSVVQNTGSRTDCDPPVYSLNLQTLINNSSRNDPASNNFEVNISIRGRSSMLADDFPPSYNEISNSSDDNVQPTLYTSSQGGVENSEERRLLRLSYSDEPPPYSLSEESTTEESPNNTTSESANDITTDSNIDENSTFSDDNSSSGEVQTVDSSVAVADTEQTFNENSEAHETTSSNSESVIEQSNVRL